MSPFFKTTTITEGSTPVIVPVGSNTSKGPGEKQGLPFYNPAMELNRDLSLLVTKWFYTQQKKPITYLDGLAASGIRGVRIAHELPDDLSVTINDVNAQAYELIKKNITSLGLSNVQATNDHLNTLLQKHTFDCIDIDPFGSPIRFLDAAVQSVSHQGLLSITSTDVAALCGVYPKVCLRRYGAHPYHRWAMNEVAIRIMLGVICRIAGQHDKGITPLLSYKMDHYLRIYVQIHKGVRYANQSMKQYHCVPIDTVDYTRHTGFIGPVWMGVLGDHSIITRLYSMISDHSLGSAKKLDKLLSLLQNDAKGPPWYATTDDLSSIWKLDPPAITWLLTQLQDQGFQANKTHFHPMGFRTNASYPEIKQVFSQYQKKK